MERQRGEREIGREMEGDEERDGQRGREKEWKKETEGRRG